MKKAIWILFVALALIWTVLAFAAAGLARWTSDVIASDQMANATRQVALTTEAVTRSATKTLTETSAQLTEQVKTTLTQPVGETVAGAVQQSVDAAKSAAAGIGIPALPPLPAWVNQWLGPDAAQSINAWADWAKATAGVGAANVANTATASANAGAAQVETTANAAIEAAQAKANQAAAVMAIATAANVTPWLASIVGWLVLIVWIIWGVGLILGFIATLIVQWLVGRFIGSAT